MRMLRCLFAIALVCGLTCVAKADTDFHMVVLDPSYSVNVITTTSFEFTFSPCVSPGQVPVGSGFEGCFTGQNETGGPLTSLLMDIPHIPGQTAGCALFGGGLDIFTGTPTCTSGPDGYVLDFTGGDLAVGGYFTIAESGVCASDFPTVTAEFNAPEPSSIWLLSTGALMFGFFYTDRRRRAVRASRF